MVLYDELTDQYMKGYNTMLIRQLARQLDYTTAHLYKLIHSGRIAASKETGKWMVPDDKANRWIELQTKIRDLERSIEEEVFEATRSE